MTTNRVLALMLVVLAGGVSVLVAEGALGGSASAAVHGERPRLVFVSPAQVAAGWRELGDGSAAARPLRLDGTAPETAPLST